MYSHHLKSKAQNYELIDVALASFFFPQFVEEQIDHPVLITECICNPVQSRSKMAELLFETYGVPSVGNMLQLVRGSLSLSAAV